ncbi:MAG: ArsR/SmtB family transcription factor [Gaiellaceae bacterium]
MTAVDMSSELLITCCRPLTATLSEADAEATASLFRLLGDPARVRIVNLLATSDEPVCVCELVGQLELAQPTVSHHLKKLTDSGLLEREQRGRWAYFSLRPGALERLGALLDFDRSSKGGQR